MRHGNVARDSGYQDWSVHSAPSNRFSSDSNHGDKLLGTGVTKCKSPVVRVIRRNPSLGVASETLICGISRRSWDSNIDWCGPSVMTASIAHSGTMKASTGVM